MPSGTDVPSAQHEQASRTADNQALKRSMLNAMLRLKRGDEGVHLSIHARKAAPGDAWLLTNALNFKSSHTVIRLYHTFLARVIFSTLWPCRIRSESVSCEGGRAIERRNVTRAITAGTYCCGDGRPKMSSHISDPPGEKVGTLRRIRQQTRGMRSALTTNFPKHLIDSDRVRRSHLANWGVTLPGL